MTNKELLELAAKAAGLKVTNYDWQMGCRVIDDGVYKDWNPLTDDGDALRLAVKLKLDLYLDTGSSVADTPFGPTIVEKNNSNEYATTRCAIVRAAAAIGETLA